MTDLVAQLTALSGMGEAYVWLTFLVFLRVGAAMALLPAFGEQSVPTRVRLVLTLAFTAIVAPAVSGAAPAAGVLSAAAEVLSGLAIGLGLRMFVLALQMAGAIAAQATSLSQVFGGTGPEPLPALGNLLVMAGLALAVMSGLHVRAAAMLILSYDVLPLGRLPNPSDMADWGLMQIARAFSLAFTLAMPFVIAALIYNVALGIINRAMPQLMVSFVGAPALTAGSLALMAVVVPLALGIWLARFNSFLAAPFSGAP